MPSPFCPRPVVALALCVALLASTAARAEPDPRRAFGEGSPDWLRAVGKLHVPAVRYSQGYGSHRNENCSATLVGGDNQRPADTLVTAWHCLEDYRDLSRPITFTLLPDSDAPISREAYRVADGGGMYADWAVLKLAVPIERKLVAPLAVHPQRADPAVPVTMAGYSSDAGLGRGGQALTYDADCSITGQAGRESRSDCRAFKGASGGAVIQRDGQGRAQLCGVISRGDGVGLSIYVPVADFRSALNRALN